MPAWDMSPSRRTCAPETGAGRSRPAGKPTMDDTGRFGRNPCTTVKGEEIQTASSTANNKIPNTGEDVKHSGHFRQRASLPLRRKSDFISNPRGLNLVPAYSGSGRMHPFLVAPFTSAGHLFTITLGRKHVVVHRDHHGNKNYPVVKEMELDSRKQ